MPAFSLHGSGDLFIAWFYCHFHLLHGLHRRAYLLRSRQQDSSPNTQVSGAALNVGDPDLGADRHSCQSFIAASGPCGCHDSAAILEGHVGDQLLPLPPPFTIDDRNEFAASQIILISASVKFGFSTPLPVLNTNG